MSIAPIKLAVELDFKKVQEQLRSIDKHTVPSGGKNSVGKLGDSANKSTKEISRMTAALNSFGMTGDSVGGIIGKLTGKVLGFVLITSSVIGGIRAIQGFIRHIKELEDATIRLQRIMMGNAQVIDLNTKRIYSFAKSMNILAGATYVETIDASERAIKAGFEFNDSLKLTQAALLATNVTEMSTEQSTRYLIAAIRQFNLTAKDSLNIINQWNELGKRTGATSQAIAEGVTRSGKAFQAVGGTLTQLNSILASVIETTGSSGEKIGTALRTLSARFADVNRRNSFSDEISRVTLSNGKAITKVYNEATGEFNSFFNIMYELSTQWDKVNDKQRIAIAKAGAGIRRYGEFLSVVENFGGAIRGLIIAIDSQNSALEENERRVNSLDFKMRQFQGAISELALSSGWLLDVMKNFVDTGTALMRTLDKMDSKIAGIVGQGLVLGATFLTFTGILSKLILVFGKITAGIFGVTAAVVGLKMAILPISGVLALLAMGTATYAINKQKATLATERLKSALVDETVALENSKAEILKNVDLFVKLYKEDSEFKGNIAEMFERVANVNLSKVVSQTDSLKVSIQKVTEALGDTRSFQGVVESYRRILIKNMSSGATGLEGRLTVAETILGKGFTIDTIRSDFAKLNSELDTQLKSITETRKSFIETLSEKLAISMVSDKDKINSNDFKSVTDMFNNVISLSKKGLSLTRGFFKNLKKDIQSSIYYDRDLSKSLDAYEKNIDSKVKLSKKEQTELDNTGKLIDELAIKYGVSRDKAIPALREIIESHKDLKESQLRDLIELEDKYLKMLEKINKGLVKSFIDPLMEITKDQTLWDNILNAFAGLGGKIYDTMKNSIIDGITDGLAESEFIVNFQDKIRNEFSKVGDALFGMGGILSPSGIVENLGKGNINVRSQASLGSEVIGTLAGGASLKALDQKNGFTLVDMGNGKYGWVSQTVGKHNLDMGNLLTTGLLGASMGAFSSSASGRNTGQGALQGGILSLIGEAMLPGVGGIIGGLLGGLFGNQAKSQEEERKESLNYAKQSTKELQYINRNTSAMVEELRNFSVMQDSYYFSFNNSMARA